MSTIDLGTLAPLLVVIPASATVLAARWTIQWYRGQRLNDRLAALFNENKAVLLTIRQTDRQELVADPAQAADALKVLLQFQQVAKSVSCSPRHWDDALPHDGHAVLRSAVEQASLLIQTVRRTDWTFPDRPWNGSRRRAFQALLKACAVKLPKNR